MPSGQGRWSPVGHTTPRVCESELVDMNGISELQLMLEKQKGTSGWWQMCLFSEYGSRKYNSYSHNRPRSAHQVSVLLRAFSGCCWPHRCGIPALEHQNAPACPQHTNETFLWKLLTTPDSNFSPYLRSAALPQIQMAAFPNGHFIKLCSLTSLLPSLLAASEMSRIPAPVVLLYPGLWVLMESSGHVFPT